MGKLRYHEPKIEPKEYENIKKEERKLLEKEIRQREMRMLNPAWTEIKGKVENVLHEKRNERMQQEQQQQREYQMMLDRIHLKVLKQPTLFQRQSRMNAKQNVEKKYLEVLKKEGLTEEDISKSNELKKERRQSSVKSSMSDYSWTPKPCPVSSIKSATAAATQHATKDTAKHNSNTRLCLDQAQDQAPPSTAKHCGIEIEIER